MTNNSGQDSRPAALHQAANVSPDVINSSNESTGSATAVYYMLLISIIFGPLLLVALITAFVYRDSRSEWIGNHHRFQIRTIWIGMLYGVGNLMLLGLLQNFGPLAFLALLGGLFCFIWFLVRTVRGLKALNEKREPKNWKTWGF